MRWVKSRICADEPPMLIVATLSRPEARPPSSRRSVDELQRRVVLRVLREDDVQQRGMAVLRRHRRPDLGDPRALLQARGVASERRLVRGVRGRALAEVGDHDRRRRGARRNLLAGELGPDPRLVVLGELRRAPLPKFSDSAGIASTSRKPAERIAESAGRRITRSLHLRQNSPCGTPRSAAVLRRVDPAHERAGGAHDAAALVGPLARAAR